MKTVRDRTKKTVVEGLSLVLPYLGNGTEASVASVLNDEVLTAN